MILCFGTFAKVLNCCKQILPQDKFVPRLAWVVDKMNSSLAVNLKSEDISDNFDIGEMEGNPAVVSKLLSCNQRFELRDKSLPSVEVASESFKSAVMPYINEDKIVKAVLTIFYIISKDETIVNERKETFRKFVGMYKDELFQQIEFDVPEFFARVLLYTTCVDNNEGRPYAKEITDDFIEKGAAAIEDSGTELKWDTTTKTVKIICSAGIPSWVRAFKSISPDYYAQLLRSYHTWDMCGITPFPAK